MPRFKIRLLATGPSKIEIIKRLREATRPPLGLSEAKYLIDHPPGTLPGVMEEAMAQGLSAQLEQLGCEVELLAVAEVTVGVRVENVGPRKINVIKIVREVLGVGLKEAKDQVDGAPFEVSMKELETAEALAGKLREVGAEAHVTGDTGCDEAVAPSGLSGALVLEELGPRKINVIKVVRQHLKLGLAEAKNLVESAPVVLMETCDPVEAGDIAQQLEAVGARVSVGTTEGSSPEPSGPLKPLDY